MIDVLEIRLAKVAWRAGANIPAEELRGIMRKACPCMAALEDAYAGLKAAAELSTEDILAYWRALEICEGAREAACKARMRDAVAALLNGEAAR